MSSLRILAMGLVCLLVAATSNAAIFKWVDEEGNVHFGDHPPTGQRPQQVDVDHGPAPRAAEEARDRARKLLRYEESTREPEPGEANARGAKPVQRLPGGRAEDPECFTALEKAWSGRIADTREAVSRSALSNSSYRALRGLLDSLTGHWEGAVEETICVRADASPPTKANHYRARLHGYWKSKQLLEIEAKLVGEENRAVFREFFWLLLSRDGLRFRKANTDIEFEMDQPRNDVAILTISSNMLRFFWRRGGRLRKANVFELYERGTGFGIREFLYVQGMLAEKRSWEFRR